MGSKRDQLGQHGLALARRVLRRLDEVGIFVQPQVSLEHQHLARRYVVRGIESGGAVKELAGTSPSVGRPESLCRIFIQSTPSA